MATKRIRGDEDEVETVKREESDATLMADRFTDLPESIQLRILSSLDTKYLIQTLLRMKSWDCSWKSVPALDFSSFEFDRLYDFDRFVYKVLSLRNSVNLEKLTFRRRGTCRAKILRTIFDYAFSHGVRELEIDIGGKGGDWPIWLYAPTDSLTSLKLVSCKSALGCSFLEPRSGLFKNLTNLHLNRMIITDLDPFSRFLALDKLTVINCPVNTKGNVLNVHALRLSELTILTDDPPYVKGFDLTTPKLKYFEYRGINFPPVTTHQGGFPALETAIVDFSGFCLKNQEKIMFNDVMMLFDTICNAKSLTFFSSIVEILSLFPDELTNQRSPFRDLKCLKLDFKYFNGEKLFERKRKMWSEFIKLLPGVKTYLLHNSHDAKSIMINPKQYSYEQMQYKYRKSYRIYGRDLVTSYV